MAMNDKMKVEIWSDVMCPFCYIGKRKFEAALKQFPNSNHVEVEWKSFQLQPDLKTDPTKNTLEHLAQSKGWSIDYTRQVAAQVTQMAKEVGLHYDFEHAVVANSFDAHRLAHFAKQYGKGDAMEEQLFKAYFTDGKNTADHNTLVALAASIGLNEAEVREMIASDKFADSVRYDIAQAVQLGISGVPFFLFNERYAVSGAQEVNVFLNTLRKSFYEWEADQPKAAVIDAAPGANCKPNGDCK